MIMAILQRIWCISSFLKLAMITAEESQLLIGCPARKQTKYAWKRLEGGV